MNRIFSVAFLCITLSGCSFLPTPKSTSTNAQAAIDKHIDTVQGMSAAKVISIDNGGKKYVLARSFKANPATSCYQSSFDDFYNFCEDKPGMAAPKESMTYLVNSKGIVYGVDYDSEEAPSGS